MTSKLVLIFAFLVSLSNIGLNFFMQRAAAPAHNWLETFSDKNFAIAFFAGIISLISMAALYFFGKSSEFGMANGILLMGATSIIGGVSIGYVFGTAKIHWAEWALFFLIMVFVCVRYFIATQNR